MTSSGIRISDDLNNVISVKLQDILEEIQEGFLFNWSILFFDAKGHLGEGKSIIDFGKKINNSEKGLFVSWEELNLLSKKLDEIIDIIIIGCKDKTLLHRYKEDREMYETCDVVIEMFDSYFWEIFSKDIKLINILAKKFKKIEFLAPDFEK
jgi:hypothetical protein